MLDQIINTLILGGAFLFLFFTAEVLFHKFKVNGEITRKYVHFVSGFITFLFPIVIDNLWLVLALCSGFVLILFVTKKINMLNSIHGVKRVTHGSYLYPMSIFGSYILYDYYHVLIYFYLPVVILAVCDPIAAIAGKNMKAKMQKTGRTIKEYSFFENQKTYFGSMMFFDFASLISFIFLFYGMPDLQILQIILISLLIGLTSTISEALSAKGWDNIAIPATVIAVLIISTEVILK